MIFKQKNVKCKLLEIMLVDQVKENKYFRLILDENLNWVKHCENTQEKILPMIGALTYRCSGL